jgi:hypothetical protein
MRPLFVRWSGDRSGSFAAPIGGALIGARPKGWGFEFVGVMARVPSCPPHLLRS